MINNLFSVFDTVFFLQHYTVKYTLKNTLDQDSAKYEEVKTGTKLHYKLLFELYYQEIKTVQTHASH